MYIHLQTSSHTSQLGYFAEQSSNCCKKLVYKIQMIKEQLKRPLFWIPGLSVGDLSNCPCQWSVCLSVFKYLRDRSLVFSDILYQAESQ